MRILIADDNEMVRRGVAGLLLCEPTWHVCGEVTNGSEVLLKSREVLPDLVLLDIRMPGMNGLEVARLLRESEPEMKILVMSQYDPVQLLPRAIAAGADGCVDKSRLGTDLVASIKRIGTAH